ncbi:MAG: PBSX family phage terminase large subunit [Flavobacterium sp.]
MAVQEVNIELPNKLHFLLDKKARFKVARGGRGSAKSGSIARGLNVRAITKPLTILCTRELQNSIADSVHSLLTDCAEQMGVYKLFDVTAATIRTANGSNFIFKGLRNNISEVKSLHDVDICWVEEAQGISGKIWDILIPTIRNKDSEIWISYNPNEDTDPTHQKFGKINFPFWEENQKYEKGRLLTDPESIPSNFTIWESRKNDNDQPLGEGEFWSRYMISVEVNYVDNPFFEGTELYAEMMASKELKPEEYKNIWLGQPKSRSDLQVFKDKWVVDPFITPPVSEMYHKRIFFGADWGTIDPTTLIRCFIKDGKLYIDYEAWETGTELNAIDGLFQTVPESKNWKIYGDSSRPDIIKLLQNQKYKIFSVKKTTVSLDPLDRQKAKGYIESGVEYIRNFDKVVIHPRCVKTIEEFTNFKHKIDKTGIILPEFESGFDHLIDALRYALSEYISRPKTTMADIARAKQGQRIINQPKI